MAPIFPTMICHYCGDGVLRPGTIEAEQRPDFRATRDHTHPKCDGGKDWVVCCNQCNAIKASDPYDVFMTFMKCGGRDFRRHDRKKKYRWFREEIMKIGLAAFDEERRRRECEITEE